MGPVKVGGCDSAAGRPMNPELVDGTDGQCYAKWASSTSVVMAKLGTQYSLQLANVHDQPMVEALCFDHRLIMNLSAWALAFGVRYGVRRI